MGTPIRMTGTTQAVLETVLSDPKADHYGLQIGAEAALPSGTVHPILARLESIGWLTSGWEEIDPAVLGRPKRRYYRLTPDGLVASRTALAGVRERRAKYAAQWRPQEGLS